MISKILQNLLNLEFPNPAIIDTCDVVYYWSISLLQPIVLDNLWRGLTQVRILFVSASSSSITEVSTISSSWSDWGSADSTTTLSLLTTEVSTISSSWSDWGSANSTTTLPLLTTGLDVGLLLTGFTLPLFVGFLFNTAGVLQVFALL